MYIASEHKYRIFATFFTKQEARIQKEKHKMNSTPHKVRIRLNDLHLNYISVIFFILFWPYKNISLTIVASTHTAIEQNNKSRKDINYEVLQQTALKVSLCPTRT